MARYLVTGRAASGKSTVARELQKRGIETYDTDNITGLASWVDSTTGEKLLMEDNANVDLSRYEWLWDADILRHFVSDKDTLFLCGSADNDFAFETLFKEHFVLDVSPDLQAERLLNRTDNDYGRDPAMHAAIINKQAAHVDTAKTNGAIIIDANQPLAKVVDTILGFLA